MPLRNRNRRPAAGMLPMLHSRRPVQHRWGRLMLTHRYRTILGDIPADWDAKPPRSLTPSISLATGVTTQGEAGRGRDAFDQLHQRRPTRFSATWLPAISERQKEQFGPLRGDLLVERSEANRPPVGRTVSSNAIFLIDRLKLRKSLRPDPEKWMQASWLGAV